jgi:MFS family permease
MPPSDSHASPTISSARLHLRQTFVSIRHPNYRLWFAGQLVSLLGTWMQTTAQGFLVFQLTHSPAYLGYVAFAAGIPTWLFTLYGGVVADRMPRRNLLVITQATMMVLAFSLSALTFLGRIQPWHIILLAGLLGVANAFDAPARQSFTLEMVGRQDLANAIALNGTMFNAATAVGPAVAGLTYALAGPAWCFAINGASFLAVIGALLLMQLRPVARPSGTQSVLAELRQGFRYVAATESVRLIIATLGAYSLIGMGMVALMPAWSVQVLGGDAATNGLLLSARGAGSLAGALLIATLAARRVKGRLMSMGGVAMGLLMLGFSAVRWLPLSMLTLAGMGWGFMMVVSSANALVQMQVPDDLRGRVMSIYTLVFFGLGPVGALLTGLLAARIGIVPTAAAASLVLLIYSITLWIARPGLRQLG